MSVVRPEFGPTLPELLGPRVRTLPRVARIALVAIGVAVVALVAVSLTRSADGRTPLVVREPAAFNLLVDPGLRQVTPRGREVLRLETAPGTPAPQSFAVTPLRLLPYRGDVTAALMGMSWRLSEAMRARFPGYVWRGEGRVSYNLQPGYEIQFQAKIDGRTTYGRRILLMPYTDTPPLDGADMMLLAARSAAVPSVDAVGAGGALKTAARSLRFGEDRP